MGWKEDLKDSLIFWGFVFLVLSASVYICGCASTRTFHPMTGKPEVELSTFVRQADVVVTYDDPASIGWRRTVEIHHEPLSPSLAGVLIVLGATLGSAAGPGGAAGGGLLGGALGMVLEALGVGAGPTSPAPPSTPTGPAALAPPLRPDETGDLPTQPADLNREVGKPLWLSPPVQWAEFRCGGAMAPEWCAR